MSITANTKRFDAWNNRAFNKARAKSVAVGKRLGLSIDKFHDLYALPGHRDAFAKVARGYIALSLRMDRLSQRIGE